jgi:hypothetical protein
MLVRGVRPPLDRDEKPLTEEFDQKMGKWKKLQAKEALREAEEVQHMRSSAANHVVSCVVDNKESRVGSLVGPEYLLRGLKYFFMTFNTGKSKVNKEALIPILHNESFRVFYYLCQAGYQPVSDNAENQDSSAAGILKYGVGVAMRDMQKFAMADINLDQLRGLEGQMQEFANQYKNHQPKREVVPQQPNSLLSPTW